MAQVSVEVDSNGSRAGTASSSLTFKMNRKDAASHQACLASGGGA